MTMRFTQDLQYGINRRIENTKEADTMTTTVPIPEGSQLLTEPEGAATRIQTQEPTEDPVLADAEEEEIEQLWAADTGNQGA